MCQSIHSADVYLYTDVLALINLFIRIVLKVFKRIFYYPAAAQHYRKVFLLYLEKYNNIKSVIYIGTYIVLMYILFAHINIRQIIGKE